jgi:hypothetical protein
MTDTNYLYEYFLTHSQESADEPAASAESDEDEEES